MRVVQGVGTCHTAPRTPTRPPAALGLSNNIPTYAYTPSGHTQGHTSPITCIVTTEDRSHVVTADTGPEALLVVWNVRTGLPTRTVQQPHRHGVSTMDMSADGQWLATVSAADPESGEQEVRRRTDGGFVAAQAGGTAGVAEAGLS